MTTDDNVINWRELTLYGFDIDKCSYDKHPKEFLAALVEWRDGASMAGYYFTEAGLAARDDDADETPSIDWAGFPTNLHLGITMATLYAAVSGEQIVTNDRGNGAGGPGFIQRAFSVDMSKVVTEVTKDEDEDAWQLARDAFRLLGFDGEPFRVFVGERSTKDGSFDPSGHQMIYAI